jgi:hypothetical protein
MGRAEMASPMSIQNSHVPSPAPSQTLLTIVEEELLYVTHPAYCIWVYKLLIYITSIAWRGIFRPFTIAVQYSHKQDIVRLFKPLFIAEALFWRYASSQQG